MAAVALPGLAGPPSRPVLRPVAPSRRRSRPVGPAARRQASPATYRRRRLGALAATVALVPAAHLCAALLGGGPLTAPEEPTRAVAAHVYVVQPGDTLWSIADRVEPGRDPRPLVQALTAQLGGADLQPGQALRLP